MAPRKGRAAYEKNLATRRANEEARRLAELARIGDPLEDAKLKLRKLGYTVYGESMLGGDKKGSKLVVVGSLRLTGDELLAYAAKLTGERL